MASCSASVSGSSSSPVPARCWPPSPSVAPHHIGFSAFVLTVAFAVGVAVPLLVFALARPAPGRTHAARPAPGPSVVRKVIGAVLLATALVFGLT